MIDSIPADRLTVIPDGYRNSIYWHAGHLLEEQVSLLYSLVGRGRPLDEKYIRYFDRGTSPADFDEAVPLFDEVRRNLECLVDMTRDDLSNLEKSEYTKPLTVSLGGFTLRTFCDALAFVALHEAYHLGAMTAMKKLL